MFNFKNMKSGTLINLNSLQIQQTSWSTSSNESDTTKHELESLFAEK